jgi:hypothetical protein
MSQFVGQQCLLQPRVSSVAGHVAPPQTAGVCVRVLVCDPSFSPQLWVQAPQEFHVATPQSTGQQKLLHCRVSCVVGHVAPPQTAGVCVRVLVCEPALRPQLWVQDSHVFHAATPQSTGQQWLLQPRVSCVDGHTEPPHEAGVWVRVLVCEPALRPQLWVQVSHEPHVAMPQSTGQQ